MKILVVEDQRKLGSFLLQGLTEAAYTTRWVRTCAEAMNALADTNYDAVVLDLTLPDGDGLELLGRWRKAGFNEPVLILSARDTVESRIRGLDLGADDYLPKPFSFEELLARIRSLVRRQSAVKLAHLKHASIEVDLASRVARIDGSPLDLTKREYALLEIFMLNPGRILTRTLISEKIWSSQNDIDTNLLDVYMSRLRLKLESRAGKSLFKTVRGVGYQLI